MRSNDMFSVTALTTAGPPSLMNCVYRNASVVSMEVGRTMMECGGKPLQQCHASLAVTEKPRELRRINLTLSFAFDCHRHLGAATRRYAADFLYGRC